MQLGHQILRLRKQRGWSQEVLATKLYVSRQTISNWENDKSYPELDNLLLLSTLFAVSLDELVKGDVSMMKTSLTRRHLHFWINIIMYGWFVMPIVMGAAIVFLHQPLMWGIYIAAIVLLMVATWRMAVIKRREHLQTYADILAFLNRERVDAPEIQRRARRFGTRKTLRSSFSINLISAATTLLILLASVWFFRLF